MVYLLEMEDSQGTQRTDESAMEQRKWETEAQKPGAAERPRNSHQVLEKWRAGKSEQVQEQ